VQRHRNSKKLSSKLNLKDGMIETINGESLSEFLAPLDLQIGSWNEVRSILGGEEKEGSGIIHQCPSDAQELFGFAAHICGVVPQASWSLVNFDNSTSLNAIEATLLRIVMTGPPDSTKPLTSMDHAFLFRFDVPKRDEQVTRVKFLHTVFLILLFRMHGQIVWDGLEKGQYLSLRDGFVAFGGGSGVDIFSARLQQSVNTLSTKPFPKWYLQLVAEGQEEVLLAHR